MTSISAHQSSSPQRLLIARRSSLGDIIHTLPTLVALRRKFPQAYIAWLVDHRFREVIEGHKCLDEVIPIRRYNWRSCLPLIGEVRRVTRLLRARQFDLALDLQGLLKSGAMCYLSGAPRRLGFAKEHREFNRLWVNELVPGDTAIHAVDRYLMLADYLDCPTNPVAFELPIGDSARRWAEQFLAKNSVARDEPLVGLNLGASESRKLWPVEHFSRLADLLHQQTGAHLIMLGSPVEAPLADTIQDLAEAPLVNAVGQTTLKQLAALLERCTMVVSADTGPLHIAVAVGTPVVALYGPTNPGLTGPYGDNNIIIWSQPACGPCRRNTVCRDYHCMREIRPDCVAQAVTGLLASDPHLAKQSNWAVP